MKRNEAKALLKWLMNSIVELNIGQIYQELAWRIDYFMNKKQGIQFPCFLFIKYSILQESS